MVCLCRGVSERTVAKAIDRGATTIAEVGMACGAGTGCGVCRATIADMIITRVSVRRHPVPDRDPHRGPAFAGAFAAAAGN